MIIGIDFSINSTAVTIKSGNDIVMMSFVPNYEPKKRAWRIHESISNLVQIHSYKKEGSSKDSIEDQRIKLRNANQLSDLIINSIGRETLKKVDRINIEGFSYASKGNSFIDLITYNTFLKTKLFQAVGDRIYVVPPKTLKKWYTGNGNATKCGMLISYLEKNDNDLTCKIREWCKIDDEEFSIPKPFDDLVDSIALAELA